jgi:hypothetical protein
MAASVRGILTVANGLSRRSVRLSGPGAASLFCLFLSCTGVPVGAEAPNRDVAAVVAEIDAYHRRVVGFLPDLSRVSSELRDDYMVTRVDAWHNDGELVLVEVRKGGDGSELSRYLYRSGLLCFAYRTTDYPESIPTIPRRIDLYYFDRATLIHWERSPSESTRLDTPDATEAEYFIGAEGREAYDYVLSGMASYADFVGSAMAADGSDHLPPSGGLDGLPREARKYLESIADAVRQRNRDAILAIADRADYVAWVEESGQSVAGYLRELFGLDAIPAYSGPSHGTAEGGASGDGMPHSRVPGLDAIHSISFERWISHDGLLMVFGTAELVSKATSVVEIALRRTFNGIYMTRPSR